MRKPVGLVKNGDGITPSHHFKLQALLVWNFTTEDAENTEALLPYLRVSNQDLRVLRDLRGWNSSIHDPSPAPFAAPTEKRIWTFLSLIAVG